MSPSKTLYASEYPDPLDNLARFRVPRTLGISIQCAPKSLARIRNMCGSYSSMTRAGSAFVSRKHCPCHLKNMIFRSSVTPGDIKLRDAAASRQIQQTYRAVFRPLLDHKQHKRHPRSSYAPIRHIKRNLNL